MIFVIVDKCRTVRIQQAISYEDITDSNLKFGCNNQQNEHFTPMAGDIA